MKRWLLSAVLLLLGIIGAHADESSATNAVPMTDPALVSQHYRQVLARPEFQESEEPDANAQLKEWLSQWFNRLGAKFGEFEYAKDMPAFASMLITVLTVISVAALLYIMVRLTRRKDPMEIESSSYIPGQKLFRPPESYDVEIRQAIGAGNWHGAWLAAWRQFLSRLENRHLVEPDRTRTNREYLAQLRAQTIPSSTLALLTGMVEAYDRFIYGRQVISEVEWNQFHDQINEAALLLHLEDKSPGSRIQEGKP